MGETAAPTNETKHGKKVAIVQPNYLPWRGYFDLINDVDTFIFLDDAQYTVRDWRNRNKVLTRQGQARWITVPVIGGRNQQINQVVIDDSQRWRAQHLKTLQHNYHHTPFFEQYFTKLEALLCATQELLAELTIELTREICKWLSIDTELLVSSHIGVDGDREDRLLNLVAAVTGTEYVSGPSAAAYLQPDRWEEAGLTLSFKHYADYVSYPQNSETRLEPISIVDTLFCIGKRSIMTQSSPQ